MSIGGGPEPDAFSLDRVGRGRLFGGRGGIVLERRDGASWVAVQRFADRAAASRALDLAVAEGGSPTDYRLTTPENAGAERLLWIGVLTLAPLVLISLWLIILR
jgi:hypothetical protein